MSRMVASVLAASFLMTAASLSNAADQESRKAPKALDFKMKSIAGKEVDLAKYQGKVVLIVNVASKCGLTPQYEQLQGLHKKYADQGLVILGFPCNQFREQEPGTAEEIQQFCRVNYGVQFDLFDKIEVNGDGANPLYKHLTALETKPQGPGKISWNFEKFLIGRDGQVVARFAPKTRPDDPEVIKAIEAELAKR
ncbi:MAG: glutathione peroxidase [Thermoguttaceae bacterium]